jgi:predicted dehydrogenase
MDSRFTLESGCFSRKPDVNRMTAVSWGLAEDRVHASYEQMLDAEAANLDAIVVLTPVADHARMIEDCLERGLHVISEKPLTGSVAECKRLEQALAGSGKFLAVTFNYTGYPMIRELRELVRRGDFGSIHSVRLTMQQEGFSRRDADGKPLTPQSWRLEDGVIPTVSLDLGTHVLHLLEFVVGKVPAEVSSRMGSFGSFRQVVDDVDVLINCTDGSFAHAWWSKSALGHSNGLSIEVFGTEGSAKWVQVDPEFLYLRDNGGLETKAHRGSRGTLVANEPRYNRFKAGHPSGFIEAFANCYVSIADGLDRLEAGDQDSGDYVFGLHNSLRVLTTLESATAAAQSRAWEMTGLK